MKGKMNREIKFRAWHKNMHEMNYEPRYFGEHNINDLINNQEMFQVFMQYTGFKDKNGKEIYESDVLRGGYSRYEIKWGRYGYDEMLAFHPINSEGEHYSHFYGAWDGSDFEVIGNIYENPELLEESHA